MPGKARLLFFLCEHMAGFQEKSQKKRERVPHGAAAPLATRRKKAGHSQGRGCVIGCAATFFVF